MRPQDCYLGLYTVWIDLAKKNKICAIKSIRNIRPNVPYVEIHRCVNQFKFVYYYFRDNFTTRGCSFHKQALSNLQIYIFKKMNDKRIVDTRMLKKCSSKVKTFFYCADTSYADGLNSESSRDQNEHCQPKYFIKMIQNNRPSTLYRTDEISTWTSLLASRFLCLFFSSLVYIHNSYK